MKIQANFLYFKFMKQVSCASLGIRCKFVAEGTEEELVQAVKRHVAQEHRVYWLSIMQHLNDEQIKRELSFVLENKEG